jgi:hypothetical protein
MATSHLVSHLLESAPLLGRQHLLQSLVYLAADLIKLGRRLSAQLAQLVARIIKDLLNLSRLVRCQAESFIQVSESEYFLASTPPFRTPVPRVIKVESQRPGEDA